MSEIDEAELAAMLTPPDRPVDEGFVGAVARRVEAEARLAAARRSAWVRLGWDLAGAVAVLAVVVLMAGLGQLGHRAPLPPAGLGMTAVLLLSLWCLLSLAPPSRT